METPPGQRAPVVELIKRPLEAFKHIDDARKPGRLQRLARQYGTVPAPANEYDGPADIAPRQPLDLVGKLRIDLPIRRFLPRHVLRANRMTDVHELDLRPTIDQQRSRVGLQKCVGGRRVKVLHGQYPKISEYRYYGSSLGNA